MSLVGVFVVAVTVVALVAFTLDVKRELHSLGATSRGNIQWTLVQFEVEFLSLVAAVAAAEPGDTDALSEIRKRFDIAYSRLTVLREGSVFQTGQTRSTALDEAAVKAEFDALIPLIDGPDRALADRLPDLGAKLGAIRSQVRTISVHGMEVFARQVDHQREAFAALLFKTGSVGLALIAVLAVLLVLLARLNRISTCRAEKLRLSAIRFESTINAALDAIAVTDADGTIVAFNPAAEATFGCPKETALGRNLAGMLAAPADMCPDAQRPGTAGPVVPCILGRGRVELLGLRADGVVFPAEVRLASTDGPDGPIFVASIHDITDRRRAEKAVKDAHDQALAAAKSKSDLLAVMSHEMRTPLNGVLAVLDLIGGTVLTQKQRDYVATATGSAEILQRHIDDVLDITQMEAGRLELAEDPFDLATLLVEVADANRPTAEARFNTIEVTCEPSPSATIADRRRLRQILDNLVSNAVKFTEGGHILIAARTVEVDGAALTELKVKDSGIGIAAEDRTRIFDDFVTLDTSYRRTTAGSGLGLALTRRLVGSMGGEIAVESAVGIGSCFMVRLPLRIGEAEAETPAPCPAAMIDGAGPDRPSLHVLVVDDNETNRFAAREMLLREGCRVSEAGDGLAAVAISERSRFDLILMDISMPRLDGIEATRRIRAGTGPAHDTTIVGLTAHALPNDQARMREAGMQDCMIKPLRVRNLRQVLSTVCQQAAPERAVRYGTSVPIHRPGTVLDHSVVSELQDVLPPDVLADQLDAFRQELASFGESLRRAVDSGSDLAEVGHHAHRACGSASMFGTIEVRDMLSTLEDICVEGEPGFAALLLGELDRATGRALEALSYTLRTGD